MLAQRLACKQKGKRNKNMEFNRNFQEELEFHSSSWVCMTTEKAVHSNCKNFYSVPDLSKVSSPNLLQKAGNQSNTSWRSWMSGIGNRRRLSLLSSLPWKQVDISTCAFQSSLSKTCDTYQNHQDVMCLSSFCTAVLHYKLLHIPSYRC